VVGAGLGPGRGGGGAIAAGLSDCALVSQVPGRRISAGVLAVLVLACAGAAVGAT